MQIALRKYFYLKIIYSLILYLSKRYHIRRSINKYLIVYIVFLLMEVLLCTMLKLYVESYQGWESYLGKLSEINFSSLVTDILSFLILFNYIVPISLYTTVGKILLLAQFRSIKIIYISVQHKTIY